MVDMCLSCNTLVRPRQHAITCDECGKWCHRKCNTGISFKDYMDARKEKTELSFMCQTCTVGVPTGASIIENGNVSIDNGSDGSLVLSDFDITRDIEEELPLDESLLPEDDLSETILENPTEVTYEVVPEGTKRGKPMLVTSEGFSFTIKKKSENVTSWRCGKWSKALRCPATITEKHGNFNEKGKHVHGSDPAILTKTKLRAKVKKAGREDVFKSAQQIVEDEWRAMVIPEDFGLPNPVLLQRSVNLHRQLLRPEEPKSTDIFFDIDHDFLKSEGFYRGEVMVDQQRQTTGIVGEGQELVYGWYL